MGKRITAVSFEADGVQVVTVQINRGSLKVERALTLQLDQFDAFLARERVTDFLVAINPADAIFETIRIPPVEKKLESALVRSEAARLHPELKQFSCAYRVLGDLPSEGRILRTVACCLVAHESVEPLLAPFIRHNRSVRRMVATPHILAALVDEQLEETADAVLCAHDDGHTKTLFLLDNGSVKFSRSVASNGYGWDPLDRQNIAMTLDYCFQSLRIRADRVLILNATTAADPDQPPPRLEPVPLPAGFEQVPAETVQTALVPLSLALYHFPEQMDLLPQEYRTERTRQRLFGTGALLCGLAALCMGLAAAFTAISGTATQRTIETLRTAEAPLAEAVRVHQQAVAEAQRLEPMRTFWNRVQGSPDIPHLLVALNGIARSSVTLTALTLKQDAALLRIHIAGSVNGTSFSQVQERFEAYLSDLRSLKGLEVTRPQLDPKAQTFTVEGGYQR